MSKIVKPMSPASQKSKGCNNSRRNFLAYSTATLTASGLLLIGCKEDDPVPPALTAPKAPSNLTADNVTTGQITLSWKDNADDEDGFSIERSTMMDSGFAEVSTVGKDIVTYVDKSVDPATTYYYKVRAKKGALFSDYSNVVNSMTGEEMMTVSFGEGDIAILNYAYALEQLEAAFYTQVVDGAYYAGADAEEKAVMMDLKLHEVSHRELFKKALGEAAIPGLKPNFTKIDFASRDSVLNTAKAFEDLGVSAYNGAGQFIKDAVYLTLAGKIVSVEARHASAIRDLINPDSMDFAGDDIIDPDTGLEITRTFKQVLDTATPFLNLEGITLDTSGLPTDPGFQIAMS